ncbi:MAG: hypothetical protein HOM11_17980 [Methylococcales bacterium]|jgi:hypothetical protein|nr:hypothetical protein [Methylococcales bacterium]MBT7443041.1 hypothetical protein [Methylococcales bacterium]
MTDQHDDVPVLEEVVFPCNEIDEALSNDGTETTQHISEDQLKAHIMEAVEKELDSVIEKAIFRTLQDSIAILAEEMKDEVKTNLQQSLDSVISQTFKKLK